MTNILPCIKKVFYCYAQEDKDLREELEKHINQLSNLTMWHDGLITPGQNQSDEIDKHLNAADVILLLVSPDFTTSVYFDDTKIQRILERHQQHLVIAIPILLRPILLKSMPFSHLMVLPTNGEPVTLWRNQDHAFASIAATLQQLMEGTNQLERNEKDGITDLSFAQKSGLVNLLLACSSIRNNGTREAIFRQLPYEITNGIERHSVLQVEVVNVVDHCLIYPGALHELLHIINFFEKGSWPVKQLNNFMSELSKNF